MNEIIKQEFFNADLVLSRLNKSYEREVKVFLTHIKKNGFTTDSVIQYLESLNAYSASTINKNLSAIKKTLKILFDSPSLTEIQKWKMEKFLSEIKSRKISKGEKVITADKILSDSELQKMINKSPKRTSLIFEFLFFTGCRISEALNIEFGSIKKEQSDFIFFRVLGKGKKERTVKIPIELYNRINDTFRGKTYLFESKSGNKLNDRNVAKEFRRLGLKHIGRAVNPHQLRHTRATQLIQKTGKIKAVSEYLGHSSTAITLDMYNHEILDDSDLEV